MLLATLVLRLGFGHILCLGSLTAVLAAIAALEWRRRPRARPQVGLKTVFLLVAAIGISIKTVDKYGQMVAVSRLRSLGASVYYDYQSVQLAKQKPPPDWLRDLIGDELLGDMVVVRLTGAWKGPWPTFKPGDWERIERSLPHCKILDLGPHLPAYIHAEHDRVMKSRGQRDSLIQ